MRPLLLAAVLLAPSLPAAVAPVPREVVARKRCAQRAVAIQLEGIVAAVLAMTGSKLGDVDIRS